MCERIRERLRGRCGEIERRSRVIKAGGGDVDSSNRERTGESIEAERRESEIRGSPKERKERG